MGAGIFLTLTVPAYASAGIVPASSLPWWFWPLALFVTCFFIGIVAVPAGIGGGTLFVPLIGADRARIESYRPLAEQIRRATGYPVRLKVFAGGTVIDASDSDLF